MTEPGEPRLDPSPDPSLDQRQIRDEAPPVLGSWPRLYVFVLAYLACTIALFYFLTRRLAP